MAQQHGSLSIAQVRILRVLSYGGMLTEHQIKMSAALTEWKTRRTLANLVRLELIMTGPRNNRFEITQRGRNTLATEGPVDHFKINGTWWRGLLAKCRSHVPLATAVRKETKGLRDMRGSGLVVAPPSICGSADVELAHRLMRRHRACRVDRCAWKWVAYYTLVRHGRIVPQKLSPRERAYRRGLAFPAEPADHAPFGDGGPELRTFQRVLDGLNKLAEDLRAGDGCQR